MKTLLVMRHARSSWKDSKLADHERPLNKRGHKDALLMGEVLLEKELQPQKILASTAVRARETVEGVAKSNCCSEDMEFSDALYLAEPDAYLSALRTLPDELERVMVVGHNPGLEGLLQKLSGRIETIEAGTVAYLSLPIHSWAEISIETEGEVIELLHMHDLREKKSDKKKDKREEKKRKEGKEVTAKILKKEKAAELKRLKEEKETAAKIHKVEETAELKKRKEEKSVAAAAAKVLKEQKTAELKRLKDEKAAAAQILKEEKAAEQKKLKVEKEAAGKIRKQEKAAELVRRKEEKESARKVKQYKK